MKYIRKIFEADNTWIDYDRFNRDHSYRYSLRPGIFKKVMDEMHDEIIEFFYSIIDDVPEISNPVNKGDDNYYTFRVSDNFYRLGKNDFISSSNTLGRDSKDFAFIIRINLVDFDDSIIKDIKSIYDNINDSGYRCHYESSITTSESNYPECAKRRYSVKFLIYTNDMMDRIGIDINKIHPD